MTKRVQQLICTVLREGNYRRTACKISGLPVSTFGDWMRWGAEEPKGKYGVFRQAVLRAEADGERNAVKAILAAAKNEPRHFQWWLTHRFPDRWADKHKIDQRTRHSGRIDTSPDVAAREVLDGLVRDMAKEDKLKATLEAAMSGAAAAVMSPEAEAEDSEAGE